MTAVYVRKPDGSVTSVNEGTKFPPEWTVIDEAAAREEHPSMFGIAPADGSIPVYAPAVQVGEIDPRIIAPTWSVGDTGYSRRNERPEDVARRAAEQAGEATP